MCTDDPKRTYEEISLMVAIVRHHHIFLPELILKYLGLYDPIFSFLDGDRLNIYCSFRDLQLEKPNLCLAERTKLERDGINVYCVLECE